MGRLVLFAILALIAGLAIPKTRPHIVERATPLLYPVHKWQTESEMEQIGREIASYERTYYKLPVGRHNFDRWLSNEFQEESAKDTWGTRYEMRVWPDSFAILSAGPDLEIETDDDLRHLTLRLTARAERAR